MEVPRRQALVAQGKALKGRLADMEAALQRVEKRLQVFQASADADKVLCHRKHLHGVRRLHDMGMLPRCIRH